MGVRNKSDKIFYEFIVLTLSNMIKLAEIVNDKNIELVIWDFDGVICKLDWTYPTPSSELLKELCSKINDIDKSIIKDDAEFIARKFPYPEINEVGVKYGRETQLEVKSLYLKREMASVDRAIAFHEVIELIKKTSKPQAIWSNNYSNTIEYLLEKNGIKDRIGVIVSIDKVILSKPDIEGFALIKNRYPNIKKENIVLIGDSLVSDKVAAENSAIRFFHYIGSN